MSVTLTFYKAASYNFGRLVCADKH
jgi:hypothetical protein